MVFCTRYLTTMRGLQLEVCRKAQFLHALLIAAEEVERIAHRPPTFFVLKRAHWEGPVLTS
jgi:hypothetical protein